MTHTKLAQALLITTLTLSFSSCIVHVGGHNSDNDKKREYSSVFGGVEIEKNQRVGDLSSVNGNIELDDGVRAEDVEAVNGNIEMGANVTARDVSTVNGDIKAKQNLSVKGDMSTVNGNISIAANSTVGQDITTVNGDIHLTQSTVNEDIKTQNGSITLTNGSVVEGNIEFESQQGNKWWGDEKREHNPPTLTIDASSDVKGKIILHQVVILEIENPDLLAKVERHYKGQE